MEVPFENIAYYCEWWRHVVLMCCTTGPAGAAKKSWSCHMRPVFSHSSLGFLACKKRNEEARASRLQKNFRSFVRLLAVDRHGHTLPQTSNQRPHSTVCRFGVYWEYTKNYAKSPCLMGKFTISLAIFNSYFDITRGYSESKQWKWSGWVILT